MWIDNSVEINKFFNQSWEFINCFFLLIIYSSKFKILNFFYKVFSLYSNVIKVYKEWTNKMKFSCQKCFGKTSYSRNYIYFWENFLLKFIGLVLSYCLNSFKLNRVDEILLSYKIRNKLAMILPCLVTFCVSLSYFFVY